MEQGGRPAGKGNREAAGFAASLLFVCLASVRDVYLGGLFQRVAPPVLAIVAFSLCAAIFLPIAWLRSPESLQRLRGRLSQLLWVNLFTALAWISFFHALQSTEPMLVQILFAGVGPLTVGLVDRFVTGTSTWLGPGERGARVALAIALVFGVTVALAGLSGVGPRPLGTAALGVTLALGAGISISVSTVLCRGLHDAGIAPTALVAVRFLGAIVLAAGLAFVSGTDLHDFRSPGTAWSLVGASLLLIVMPVYVSQVGISLASPFTVRVVLAVAPALVFALQLVEGRLSSSPYSIGGAVLYGASAIWATVARQRTIVARPAVAPPGQRGTLGRRASSAGPDGRGSTMTIRSAGEGWTWRLRRRSEKRPV